MAVPTKPPVDMEPALVCPSRHNVLHRARQDVPVMRQSSRERRTIVEYVPEARNTHKASHIKQFNLFTFEPILIHLKYSIKSGPS